MPMNRAFELPASLAALRAAFAAGALAHDDALAAQAARFSALDARYRAAVPPASSCDDSDRDANSDRVKDKTDWGSGGADPRDEPLAPAHSSPFAPPAPSDTDIGRPLAGIGLAHKDIFFDGSHRPGCGLRGSPAQPHQAPSPLLARLRAAGAARLGTLSMAQFACGSTAENPALARPINPCDAMAAVGGSSSGSAVAVASGMCHASLGTDTAGSVRIPAATCGVLGLKPTLGYLPTTGVYPLAPSLDTVGVIARSASDAALILLCAAGGRSAHGERIALDAAGLAAWLAPRASRIAVALDSSELDAQVGAALEQLTSRLAHTHAVRRSAAIDPGALGKLCETLLHSEAATLHLGHLRAHARAMGASDGQETGGEAEPAASAQAGALLPAPMFAVVAPGAVLPAHWYRAALATRADTLRRFVARHFADADLLLVPALPICIPDWDTVHTDAPRFAPRTLVALHRWMSWVNYLGLPAIVFPIGTDSRGRPISVQIIGRPGGEAALLALAHELEPAAGFGNRA
jgi:aspartyl-tRNA(Asn)/glutamyl-tRNA(Gln) amidotransferase subunit A